MELIKSFQQKFDNFLTTIGLVNHKDLGTSGDKIEDVIMQELQYPADLSTLFSYRSFDESEQLFYNNDNNVGFILEIAPIVGVNDVVLKNLQHFLDDELPENTFLQFLLIASHKVGSILDDWSSSRVSTNPALAKITKKLKLIQRQQPN